MNSLAIFPSLSLELFYKNPTDLTQDSDEDSPATPSDLARKALLKILSKKGIYELNANQYPTIHQFHSIEGLPDWMVSLSHTKDTGAALIGNTGQYLSLGVDIEWADRPINEKISKFYVNALDGPAPGLDLWAQKEAAFKTMNLIWSQLHKTLVLKDLWIKKGQFGVVHHPHQSIGFVRLMTYHLNKRPLFIAWAWIPLKPFELFEDPSLPNS